MVRSPSSRWGPSGPPTPSARPCRWVRTRRCTCPTRACTGPARSQTAKALAKVIGTLGDVDLIIAGNEATDGTVGAIAAMVADVLGLPELTHARKVTVEGRTVTVERETDDAITVLRADLPAVISVNEKINEPRYPSFKGIMAAKKKPVATLSLADAAIEPNAVGLANATSTVIESTPRPPRAAGQIITDDGDGAANLAEYLIGQKLI